MALHETRTIAALRPIVNHISQLLVWCSPNIVEKMFLGHRRINVSCWKRTEQLGHVRDVVFVAPIKGAFSNWGVPETNCHQSHRWATLCDSQHAHSCLRCAMDRPPTRLPAWSLPRFCKFTSHHSDAHIVFETSQTMNDIPYGDCFTVDQRWDIRVDRKAPDGVGPQVLIDIHLRVPFSRSCFFKKVCLTGKHIPPSSGWGISPANRRPAHTVEAHLPAAVSLKLALILSLLAPLKRSGHRDGHC